MRKELELMETIDNYLKGKMSAADQTAFKNKMNADPELQKEVALQQQLVKGIERTGLKQSARQGLKKYKLNINLRNWGLTGLAIAIVASAIAFYKPAPVGSTTRKMASDSSTPVENVTVLPPADIKTPAENPEIEVSDDPKKEEAFILNHVFSKNNLKTQTFTINPKRDTLIKSEAGLKFKIDKNSFVDMSGKPVSGPVKIKLREALTPYDIVMANLVTKTDNKVLQSGGMLHVTASSEGKEVKLPDDKSLTVSVPAKKKMADMQIFEGKETGNSINWVNPKPILKTPVVGDNVIVSEKGDRQITVPRGVEGGGNILAATSNINNLNADIATNYVFSLAKLGWANIDRLSMDPRTKEIELITKVENKTDFKYVYSRIAFPNQNIFIPGYEKADGTYSFTHGDYETTKLPIGETAVIIATATKGEKIFFASEKLTIANKQTVSLTLTEVTDPQLRKILLEQLGVGPNPQAGKIVLLKGEGMEARK